MLYFKDLLTIFLLQYVLLILLERYRGTRLDRPESDMVK